MYCPSASKEGRVYEGGEEGPRVGSLSGTLNLEQC